MRLDISPHRTRFWKRGPAFGALAVLLILPGPGAGQSVLVDEGSFRITRNGAAAGSEDFTIRRSGSGSDPQFIATAEITLSQPGGALDLRPALQVVGPALAVSAYQVKISGSREEEIFVTAGDDRFLLRTRSSRGEREQELRAVPGTVLLDLGVAHHHHFLANAAVSLEETIPVIVPREGRRYDLALSEVGAESIQIGGRPVEARHLRLGGGAQGWDVWIDSRGRVLRVDHPPSGYSAVRTEPPATFR